MRNRSNRISTSKNWETIQGHKVAPQVPEFPAELQRSRQSFLVDRSPWAICLTLAAVALAVRLAVMPFLYQENLDPERDHWMFGHEQGRVARSIVLGQGFANPLFGQTGPTAYPAPVYPYFMAGVFRIFGIYSKSSAIVIIVVNCLFSALTVVPLYFYGRSSFGERTALIAGWCWVIFPYSVYWTIMRIWDTWISTLLISILFLLTLKLADSGGVSRWAGFGLLWGFTALVNPVALAVLPGLGVWMIYTRHKKGKQWLLPSFTTVLCFAAVMSPWVLRNYLTFHKLIPVRDSLGLELYVGNNGNDIFLYDLQAGPWRDNAEWERFQRLGEVAYFEDKGRIASAFIEVHPGTYTLQCARRLLNVWTDFWSLNHQLLADDPYSPVVAVLCTLLSIFTLWGLWRGWRKDALGVMPYLIVLICYPLVYCFTHTADWYRRPIDPFFVVLAAYALSSFWPQKEERRTISAPPRCAKRASVISNKSQ